MGGLPSNRTVSGFAVELSNPKIMYVAMRDGLFKSTDAGDTWKRVGEELKNLAVVTLNPRRANEVYASTSDEIIFKSVDGGVKWKRQN